MTVISGPFVGNPFGIARPRRRAAVEALGQFNGNEWLLDHHVLDKHFVELSRFLRQQTDFHCDAGLAKDGRALTGDAGIGVEHGHDDLTDAFFGQRPSARRRPAVMGTRFEGHVNRCPL